MGSGTDIIYDRNVANETLKSGTKYERLAALVFKILEKSATVVHDLRLKGDGKTTTHQIDVTLSRAGERHRVLVECRDYGTKLIGLDQARAFNGALLQLQPATGIMLTTVGYTSGALSYAHDEGIVLGLLRSFEERDWQDRVREIDLEISAYLPGTPQVAWTYADLVAGANAERGLHDRHRVAAADVDYYDSAGSRVGSLHSLLASWHGDLRVPMDGRTEMRGHETLIQPIWVKVGDSLLKVVGFDWVLPVERLTVTEKIGPPLGIAQLILSIVDGTTDRVITNLQLSQWRFDEAGAVVPHRSSGT